MKRKVAFFDTNLLKKFYGHLSIFLTIFSIVVLFIDDAPLKERLIYPLFLILILIFWYGYLWWDASRLKKINVNIESTTVSIVTGDLFKQNGLKAIPFNEYFDTQVDDEVISKASLNGIFIQDILEETVQSLDDYISNYKFHNENILEKNTTRTEGKSQKYQIGTVCLYREYLLTAFSKFNDKNQAYLTMPEYLEFLIKFWDQINVVYAQRTVSVPIFGSGITRIKEHKNITDEELLKIMLWTFRISETRFKYPAKLNIVIHEDKIDKINLFEIKSIQNGI
ncbi:macro domain-containing protein [Haemophilus parahaemolyticus]|uniref:macro domain-containing protein n=1 Tax=Haemophilus parahaemolyticus TaxID=735 RepID=UPI001FB2DF65|nr:macro domain-containing protein [Haemophilus parahaemolyticus]